MTRAEGLAHCPLSAEIPPPVILPRSLRFIRIDFSQQGYYNNETAMTHQIRRRFALELSLYDRVYLHMYRVCHRSRLFHVLYRLIDRFFSDRVFETGAMLAYFLLFSIFPLLIFLSALIPMFHLQVTEILSHTAMIPSDIKQIILSYLSYLQRVSSTPLLLTGLVLIVLFVSRTTRSLMFAINGAMRVRTHRSTLAGGLLSVLMTVGLLMAILIALIFLVAGDWLTALLSSVFPHATALLRTWNLLKALIPPAFFFILLLCLYTVAPNRHVSPWSALPGTLFSMCFWLLFSYAFSWYVGSADRYSFLYGSLGGIVVLLLWLYFSGIVLVMGAHLNYIVMTGAAWRSRQSFIMSGNAPYYVFKD